MGDDSVEQVEVIPTGSIALNVALGVGGYPRGRIIEIYGPESSGKTTLAIHAIAEAQKAGGIAALLMPNTLSTVSMQPNWELTLTICIFPSRITGSRHWKSPNN